MDKLKLKQHLIDAELNLLNEAKKDLDEYKSENSLDNDNVKDLDDLAHSEASASFEHDLIRRVQVHSENLQLIKDISFAECTEVKPGAIVKVNQVYFIISSAKKPFTFDGKTMEGISTEAPIYKMMSGKKVGNSYSFHNQEYTIQEIL